MFCKIRIIDNEPFRKAINDVFLFLFIMGIIYGPKLQVQVEQNFNS